MVFLIKYSCACVDVNKLSGFTGSELFYVPQCEMTDSKHSADCTYRQV